MPDPTEEQAHALVIAVAVWYRERSQARLEAVTAAMDGVAGVTSPPTPVVPEPSLRLAVDLLSTVTYWATHRTPYRLRRCLEALDAIVNP